MFDALIQTVFYVCSLPAIACLSLIGSLDLILDFFQANFSSLIFKNINKQPLFKFFIILMSAFSVFFVLGRITKVKFQAANPNSNSELKKTLNNFLTSTIYMLIFPAVFFLGITIINSVSNLINKFLLHGHEKNGASLFLQMGITKTEGQGYIEGKYVLIQKEQIILRGDFSQVTAQLNQYFGETNAPLGFSNYNSIFGFLSAAAGLAVFGQLLFYLLGNFFQLLLGFLYSPFPIFKRTYDDGITFKIGKDMMISKMQSGIAINLLLAFVIFALIFIHENKIGFPDGLASVFELVATPFLVIYVRKFYLKIMQFIELKTINNSKKSKGGK